MERAARAAAMRSDGDLPTEYLFRASLWKSAYSFSKDAGFANGGCAAPYLIRFGMAAADFGRPRGSGSLLK